MQIALLESGIKEHKRSKTLNTFFLTMENSTPKQRSTPLESARRIDGPSE
jgi:hypothetical protein